MAHQLKAALEGLKAGLSQHFNKEDLDVLIKARVDTTEDLKVSSRESLTLYELHPKLIDHILAAQTQGTSGGTLSIAGTSGGKGDISSQLINLLQRQHEETMSRLDISCSFAAMIMQASFWEPRSSLGSQAQSELHRSSLELYEGSRNTETVMDMVTGQSLPRDTGACHIFQQRWIPLFMRRLGLEVNTPENTFFSCSKFEKAFDKLDVCFIPSEDGNSIHVKVLKKALLKDKLKTRDGTEIPWSQIDGTALKSTTGALPAKRACGFHSVIAIQQAEHLYGLPEQSVTVPDSAWSSPSVDRKLLDEFLRHLKVGGPELPPLNLQKLIETSAEEVSADEVSELYDSLKTP